MTLDETISTLVTAFDRGGLVQVNCREVATGNKVAVLGIYVKQKFIPLARLYGPTAYQELYPPEIDFDALKQQTPQEVPA